MQDGGKPYTGKLLVDAYSAAIKDFEAGNDPDTASAAMDAFEGDLAKIGTRNDRWGWTAQRVRAGFGQYFEAKAAGKTARLDDFLDSATLRSFDRYLVDDGELESTRRADLLGIDRKPAYLGEDGKVYVDAAGTPTEIPLAEMQARRDSIIQAARGVFTPAVGQALEGASVISKAADLTQRAIQMAVTGRDWEDTIPETDVPTADPQRPFPFLPEIGEDAADSFAKLQDPATTRAVQEILADAAQKGELDPTLWGSITSTAGFLLDFAATGEALGAAGKAAGAAARLTATGRMAADTLASAEAQTALQAAKGATRPAIVQSFKTIRDFAGYQLVKDSLHGNVQSLDDAAASGLAGAKEGAVLLGFQGLFTFARSNLMRALASSKLDSRTGELAYSLGGFGKAVASIYDKARATESMDDLLSSAAELAGQGKTLRETLVRAGWGQTRARMVEHSIDSAALGLAFGAYQHAAAKPDYDTLDPFHKTARFVAGLTSPEAVGSAGAFMGSVIAHAYAHRISWGKELQNAPPAVRAELDQRVQAIMRELAQPTNWEQADRFRKAFDAYRERNPQDGKDLTFREPWEQELAKAAWDGREDLYRSETSESPPYGQPGYEAGQPPEGIGTPGFRPPEEPPPEAAGPRAPEPPPEPTQPAPAGQEAPAPPPEGSQAARASSGPDPLLEQAREVVRRSERQSPTLVQRELNVSHARAVELLRQAAQEPAGSTQPPEAQQPAPAPAPKQKAPRRTITQRTQDVRAKALTGEMGVQAFVRAMGGIDGRKGTGTWSEELRNTLGKESGIKRQWGLGPLVRTGKGAEKARSLDYMREALVEKGWLRPDADLNETLELISGDTVPESVSGGAYDQPEYLDMAQRWEDLTPEEQAQFQADMRQEVEGYAQATGDEEPFTLFSTAPGFLPFPPSERFVGAFGGEAAQKWLGVIQDQLFPETEYRDGRVGNLVRSLVVNFGVPADQAEAAVQTMEAHASVWAKSSGGTIADWYKTHLAGIVSAPPPMGAPEGAPAATTFLEGGRAVLHALEKPTIGDVIHELAHVWRRDLQGKPRETIEKWAGVKDGEWTERADEKFARGLTKYIRSGKAPTPELSGTFGKLKGWLREVYQRLRSLGLDLKMNGEVRRAMDSLWQLPKLDEDEILRERMKRLSPEVMGDIYRANRNRPQYVGMELEQIVGHELRGGLPDVDLTPAIKLAQAGDSAREALEIARGYDVLSRDLPWMHPEAQKVLIDMARGASQALRGHFEARGGLPALSQAIEAARRARDQMRDASRSVLPDDRRRSQFDAVLKYLDAAATGSVPPEVYDELKAKKLLTADGKRIDPFVTAALGNLIETGRALHRAAGAKDPRLIEPTAAARPWMAWQRVANDFHEHALARTLKLRRLVDVMEKRKILPPEVMRLVQRAGRVFGGFWQANGVNSIQNETLKLAAMDVFRPWEAAVQTLQSRGEDVLTRIAARFGWRSPPSSHMKLLNWAIDTGALGRMKGPEDFEKLRAGTGYLFHVASDINDILQQMGNAGVQVGFLLPEQVEKMGGKYRPHLYLKLKQDDEVKELRQGRTPLALSSRTLSRRGTPDEATQLQIQDPFSWLPSALHQEGKHIQHLGVISDLVHGGVGLEPETFDGLDPYTQNLYQRWAVDPETHGTSISGGPARRQWVILSDLLAKLQNPADPHPKSEQLQGLLRRILGVDENGRKLAKGSMYLPRQVAWELDGIAAHLYNPPELDNAFQKALVLYEQATRYFRRGLTLGRPKHWTLQVLNSIGTNHVTDRLPMWDVASSMTTGHGYFADGIRDLQGMVELAHRGNPEAKPDDWTTERWDRVQLLQDAFKQLHGTTFSGVGLDVQLVTDGLGSIITPDQHTAGLLRDMQEQGYSPEAASQWRTVILDAARRKTSGMAGFYTGLHKLLGSHDPVERARGANAFAAMYQLEEMAFKWPAVLRTLETQPVGISLEHAVRYAAVGTADYGNTSPLLRSFNTTYGTLTNPLFRKTEGLGGQIGRAVLRESLKGRFWLWTSNMTPTLLSAPFAHPLRAATIMAVTTAVTAVLHSLSVQDPEDERAWQEALRGSLALAGAPLVDDPTGKMLSKLQTGYPNVAGGPSVPEEARPHMAQLWRRMLGGASLLFQAPSRGDQTRASSLQDFAPGYGTYLEIGSGIDNWKNAPADRVIDNVIDAMSVRSMELSIAMAHLGFGGLKVLKAEGPQAYLDSLKDLRGAASDLVPTLSPMFLASRDGQRLLEVTALNGQSIDEYARGIVQVEQPPAAQNLGELLFSTFWRSQRLVQPRMGGVSEREALDAIIGRLYPNSGDSPGGPYWDKLRDAQSQVHYQVAEILSGSYDEWLRWGHTAMTYDAMLVPQLFGKEGAMQRAFAQEEDPERQALMKDYFERFITSPDWNTAFGAAVGISRRRQMRPDYFRAAITNGLADPTGAKLLDWLDQKVVRGRPNKDQIEDYATAFLIGVRRPPDPGSVRYQQWAGVLKKLYDYGLSPSFMPDDVAAALRRFHVKPELAGMPALESSTLSR